MKYIGRKRSRDLYACDRFTGTCSTSKDHTKHLYHSLAECQSACQPIPSEIRHDILEWADQNKKLWLRKDLPPKELTTLMEEKNLDKEYVTELLKASSLTMLRKYSPKEFWVYYNLLKDKTRPGELLSQMYLSDRSSIPLNKWIELLKLIPDRNFLYKVVNPLIVASLKSDDAKLAHALVKNIPLTMQDMNIAILHLPYYDWEEGKTPLNAASAYMTSPIYRYILLQTRQGIHSMLPKPVLSLLLDSLLNPETIDDQVDYETISELFHRERFLYEDDRLAFQEFIQPFLVKLARQRPGIYETLVRQRYIRR